MNRVARWRKLDRSTTHQAFRDQLASVVRDLKRDNPRIDPRDLDYVGHDGMNSADIACELGYIGALLYSIEVEVANTMAYGYEHDKLRRDVQQCKFLVDHLNERLPV